MAPMLDAASDLDRRAQVLGVAAQRYRRACSVLTAAELAYANTRTTQLAEAMLHASENVIAARVALYDLLVDRGWQPPAHVVRQLSIDRDILRRSVGAVGS
jgi:hypothetical protein